MVLRSRASLIHSLRLVWVSALLIATSQLFAAAQQTAPPASQKPAVPILQRRPAAETEQNQSDAGRSSAYYHYGLAHLYEEMAVSAGRPEYATQAVEEYKLALDADPDSIMLQDGLADLYFRIGRIKDAVSAAQDQVKKNPNDVEAHTLLGQVYLRTLGDMQGAQASEMLQLAITEYETIARLKPNDLETTLLLGQLYALNNDHAKAEAQFKAAQKIDVDSEEAVLRMAALYSEEGDAQRAADTLSAVPVEDRTARIEFALAESYDQLKKPKEAAAAYRRSLEIEPDNSDVERGLASALLTDGQLDEALKVLNAMVEADPTDSQSEIRISEVQRRQGNYDEALATLEKAKSQAPDSLELNYNEALNYDALGKFDQATTVLTAILDASSHPDGNYSEPEKQNRVIFLDRLGIIDREQSKTAEAVAAYKQIVGFGGDCNSSASSDDPAHPCYAERGYDGEVEAYRDAHQWKDATAVAAEAAKALPKNHLIQLNYANQLVDTGQVDEGLTLAKAQLTGGADDRDVEDDLAQTYIGLKRFKDASDQLDKVDALANKPEEKLSVLFLRGMLYDRQKMYDQAEVQFRKALAIDPQSASVLNYLGYMLADQGQKLPEALKLIRQAVDLEPQNGAYLDSLGWVYFKLGQYSEAEENLHKAIERMNTDPTVHDHMGEVYEKTGNLKMAVAQWERSMTEYAHSLPAEADPEDVQKVQHKLENARVKLAKLNPAPGRDAK
ncbi:MAG TPA: tetratricopeptide repeat protein [Acidobacteriaceae bacterium]|nr:tetratricopeptide repeat protein [Acidobacteriaceae bacterium]